MKKIKIVFLFITYVCSSTFVNLSLGNEEFSVENLRKIASERAASTKLALCNHPPNLSFCWVHFSSNHNYLYSKDSYYSEETDDLHLYRKIIVGNNVLEDMDTDCKPNIVRKSLQSLKNFFSSDDIKTYLCDSASDDFSISDEECDLEDWEEIPFANPCTHWIHFDSEDNYLYKNVDGRIFRKKIRDEEAEIFDKKCDGKIRDSLESIHFFPEVVINSMEKASKKPPKKLDINF